MKLCVADLRAAGVEAKWGHTLRRRPVILVRRLSEKRPDDTWWLLTNGMWEEIANGKDADTVVAEHTLLGDLFSIPI